MNIVNNKVIIIHMNIYNKRAIVCNKTENGGVELDGWSITDLN